MCGEREGREGREGKRRYIGDRGREERSER